MSSAAAQESRTVEVNLEHLQSMTEMGFLESRSRRALKYFNNDLDQAIMHVCSTGDDQDDSILGPELPEPQESTKPKLPAPANFTPLLQPHVGTDPRDPLALRTVKRVEATGWAPENVKPTPT